MDEAVHSGRGALDPVNRVAKPAILFDAAPPEQCRLHEDGCQRISEIVRYERGTSLLLLTGWAAVAVVLADADPGRVLDEAVDLSVATERMFAPRIVGRRVWNGADVRATTAELLRAEARILYDFRSLRAVRYSAAGSDNEFGIDGKRRQRADADRRSVPRPR